MRKRYPTATEIVYDNYNFFVIGYSPTARPSDSIFSIAAAANGVGLAFLKGATLKDPDGILQGSGVQNRFIRLKSAATLSEAGRRCSDARGGRAVRAISLERTGTDDRQVDLGEAETETESLALSAPLSS